VRLTVHKNCEVESTFASATNDGSNICVDKVVFSIGLSIAGDMVHLINQVFTDGDQRGSFGSFNTECYFHLKP
jgi:hypothetical protein